jgi:hypothetical protein
MGSKYKLMLRHSLFLSSELQRVKINFYYISAKTCAANLTAGNHMAAQQARLHRQALSYIPALALQEATCIVLGPHTQCQRIHGIIRPHCGERTLSICDPLLRG